MQLEFIFRMSMQAGIVILVVLFIRFFTRKIPKEYIRILWILVLFRLLCPVMPESNFAIMTDVSVREVVSSSQENYVSVPNYNTWQIDDDTEPDGNLQKVPISSIVSMEEKDRYNGRSILTIVWIIGMFIMLGVFGFQYISLKLRLKTAILIEKNIWESDKIDSPFVLGIIRPRIYLPCGMKGQEREYIIYHEQAHIRHFDLLFKLLGMGALVLHWFNPLVWVGIHIMNQDMEMYCDESVIKRHGNGVRHEYSKALLAFSMKKSGLCVQLFFGESNTENRIKNILMMKRPGIWGGFFLTVLIIAVCIGFAFNKKPMPADEAASATIEESVQEPETEPGSEPAERQEALEALGREWAEAFTARDAGRFANIMASKEDWSTFGMSSPWPWGDDFELTVNTEDNSIYITYYARTSDPATWVWKEKLSTELINGRYKVVSHELKTYDEITSFAELKEAYWVWEENGYWHLGGMDDTRVFGETGDPTRETNAAYLQNQADNERGRGVNMMHPVSAAEEQLHLKGGTGRVDPVYSDENTVYIEYEFADGTIYIELERPIVHRGNHIVRSTIWTVSKLFDDTSREAQSIADVTSDLWEYMDAQRLRKIKMMPGDPGYEEETILLLAEDKASDVALYGLYNSEINLVLYREGETVQTFNWHYKTPRMNMPLIRKADYNQDGKEETAVVFETDSGTNTSVQELRMVAWNEKYFVDYPFYQEACMEQLKEKDPKQMEQAAYGNHIAYSLEPELSVRLLSDAGENELKFDLSFEDGRFFLNQPQTFLESESSIYYRE